MVISIVYCGVVVDRASRTVSCGLGSVAPRPLRATEAERFANAEIDWDRMSAPPEIATVFGRLAREAAAPISDQRGTSDYRSHAVEIITTRALQRSFAA